MLHPDLAGSQPYIETPSKLDDPPSLICFLDMARACSADCVAYTLNTPGAEYNDAWCHCTCLASLFRVSKHVVVLAQQAEDRARAAKKMADDIERTTRGPTSVPFTPPCVKVPT